MDICYKGEIESFGRFNVTRIEALDGIKFFFSEDEWVMIRISGTEPLLRTYSEAADRETAEEILDAAGKTIASLAKGH